MEMLGGRNPEVDARRLRTALGQFVPLRSPLTSTAWDGDSYSTTSKTLIDLSSVFGAPANVRAILVYVAIRDSGSAATDCYLVLGPTWTVNGGMVFTCLPAADRWSRYSAVVPCDANGDIYYQIAASGANTFDVFLQIWGYWL